MTRRRPAGTLMLPPVSVPRAKSARLAASVTTEPLEEPPDVAGGWVGEGAVVRVLVVDAAGHLVHHRTAHSRRAGGERGQNGGRHGGGRHVRPGPVRGDKPDDATGDVKAAIDQQSDY